MKTMCAVVSVVLSTGVLWAADVKLFTDREEYGPGQSVTIRFKNGSSKEVTLQPAQPRILNASGQLVYFPLGAEDIVVDVPADGIYPWVGWTWKKVDNEGKPVPPGSYTLAMEYLQTGSPELKKVTKTITLLETGSPVGSMTLTTDKPVYQAGSAEGMEVMVVNSSSQKVYPTSVLSVVLLKGTKVVYKKPAGPILNLALEPGWSENYFWSTKGLGSGIYTVKAGPFSIGNKKVTLSRFIVLTPTGKIAGTSAFPLWNKNTWIYETPEGESTEVKLQISLGGWYKAWNLLGADRWVKMVDPSLPMLVTSASASDNNPLPLFQFGRPLNYSYIVNVPGFLSNQDVKVTAVNQTVVTPAGTFKGCYRLDALSAWPSFSSFWFAPGIGLVRYSAMAKIHSLRSATIRGTDGKVYTIGIK